MWWSMVNSNATAIVPVVSNVVTALSATGACSGGSVQTGGSYTTTWSMMNPDSSGQFKSNIYANGVYVTQLFNNVLSTSVNLSAVWNAGGHQTNVNTTYRIDVIQVNTGQVVSSATGNNYMDAFGDCSGGS